MVCKRYINCEDCPFEMNGILCKDEIKKIEDMKKQTGDIFYEN